MLASFAPTAADEIVGEPVPTEGGGTKRVVPVEEHDCLVGLREFRQTRQTVHRTRGTERALLLLRRATLSRNIVVNIVNRRINIVVNIAGSRIDVAAGSGITGVGVAINTIGIHLSTQAGAVA